MELDELHGEEPMEGGRGGGQEAAMGGERVVTGDKGDVGVVEPRPQGPDVLLVGARCQADLRWHRLRWTERGLRPFSRVKSMENLGRFAILLFKWWFS